MLCLRCPAEMAPVSGNEREVIRKAGRFPPLGLHPVQNSSSGCVCGPPEIWQGVLKCSVMIVQHFLITSADVALCAELRARERRLMCL